MISCSSGYGAYGCSFLSESAIVSPVTVRQSPCSRPRSSSIFIIGRMPPIRMRWLMLYLPNGFRSARSGIRSPISLKSSMLSGTSAECAIARRCRIKLVEPPSARQVVIAFSKALRVMISRGLRSSSSSLSTAAPAFSQSLRLGSPIAT